MEIGMVCISTDRYDALMEDRFALQQTDSQIHNLMEYQERIEKAIINHIAVDTDYGRYSWRLQPNGEWYDLISILNLHDFDWESLRPQEDECAELLEEINESEAD